MDAETAREFTESLDQTGSGIGQAALGWWRQIAVGIRLNVPKALDIPRKDWAEDRRSAIGNMQLREPERKQAVAELTAPLEENGEGLNNRQAADVLGVSESTIREDRKSRNRAPDNEKSADQLETDIADAGNRAPLEERIARLDEDLAARVRDGMSIGEAELVQAQNDRRVDEWAKKIRNGLIVLSRMAGHPVPAGITSRLTDNEGGQLAAVLAALEPFREEIAA